MKIIFLLIYYLISFYSFGIFLEKLLRFESKNVLWRVVVGYVGYYGIQRLVLIGFVLTLQSLTVMMVIWMVCSGVVIIWSFLAERDKWKVIVRKRSISKADIVFVICTLLLVYVTQLNIYSTSYDSNAYISDVTTALYKNSWMQYEGTTGILLGKLNARYTLATYNLNDAILCKVFKVAPIIEIKCVVAVIVILMAMAVLYLIGQAVFKSDIGMSLFPIVTGLLLLSRVHWSQSSIFFMYRTSEGKSVLAVILCPLIFCIYLFLMKESESKNWNKILFIISISATAITMSAMFVVPSAIGILYVICWIKYRKMNVVKEAVIVLLPSILVMGLYLLMRYDIFSIYI